MPLLINTWLQRGKSPHPVVASVIILLYLFASFYSSSPPSFHFLSSQALPRFLLCSALFCTPNSNSPSCPPSYPASSLNPCIRKFSYFPAAQRVMSWRTKASVYICSVCCLAPLPSEYYTGCKFPPVLVDIFLFFVSWFVSLKCLAISGRVKH